MAGIVEKLNHVQEALDHLIQRFKDKPKLAAVITSWINQIQDLESAIFGVYFCRWLDDAEGVQLDGLGSIVDEAREGREDDPYRLAIRVRILVLQDTATPEELIGIFAAATEGKTIDLKNYFPASFTLEIDDPIDPLTFVPELFGRILQTAKPAGVNAQLLYHVAGPFQFDTGLGFDEGKYGGAVGGDS